MTGQGVSSRSSHSDAAGRTTPSAKPCTQSRRSRWSSVSSIEKPPGAAWASRSGRSVALMAPEDMCPDARPRAPIARASAPGSITCVTIPGAMFEIRLPARPWEALPASLAEALAPGVDELGAEIVAAIRAGVPTYGRPLEGEFGRGLRDGVAAALRQFLSLIGGAAH